MTGYRPLDWLMVRAPLLPIERCLAPASLDHRVRRALAVGAGDLWRAVERQPPSDRARRKLQRYLIRMSTRPTPFGLFAGVGLAGWGERTDLAIGDDPAVIRTRPDVGWLLDFVSTVERRPAVRAGLRTFANPAAFEHSGRIFLSEHAPIGGEETGRQVSIRATGVVREALELARNPLPYKDLVTRLMASTGAPQAKVERLAEQLWEQTLLLTDLRPPLTIAEPARYVVDRLADIPAAADDTAALSDLLDLLKEWDQLDAEQGVAVYPKLLARARALHESKDLFQTDATLPLTGNQVSRVVGDEAAKAAGLLSKLTKYPAGLTSMRAYRDKFTGRYGHDREVPLLELLDREAGLGLPEPPAEDRNPERDGILTRLALDAIRDRRQVVDLDEQTIDDLAIDRTAPELPSLDLSVFVLASSPEAVDAGDFQMMVGPNFGASAAGRVLGRFSDLLGDQARTALRSVADAEAAVRPGRVWAEVNYLPRKGRLGNVATRALIRDHELSIADNRLLLDLADPDQLKQLPDKGLIVLQEALPAPDQAWLPGGDGHYVSELVVPLVREEVEPEQQPARQIPSGRRMRPPGSDWLFAKLYHLPTFENDLLTGPVKDFCEGNWFFMRYVDPDPHLRIRWTGDPRWLTDELAPRVLRWSAELVERDYCTRVALDTYDQELERYGGPAALEAAELLFAADSSAVLDLLRRHDIDRTLLGMYTVDDLLLGLGLTEDERLDNYRRGVADRRATADEFRSRQVELRHALGNREFPEIEPVLARRRAVLREVGDRLDWLADRGELGKPKTEIARSFVHMHCNRLLGCGHPPEQKVLGLLTRTWESLRRAPVRRGTA
ncbi:hypothetical protein DMH04_36685 [Kibdelosporangium aridum]|uniref:Thiopeptide-type bacteriocin biosynthesis domain-containing protein n=1 Tax=Kibdelosporangium aridum TaxID=2030 RepID=A0A428YZB2_KIBAR|nr:lantibiotic dehydratase [Kibdelosporangium aridum]RSM76046.1 hypothetical protein DMH04_36685 [Kibdelosporangium aridum]